MSQLFAAVCSTDHTIEGFNETMSGLGTEPVCAGSRQQEQRAKHRYPIALELQYQLMDRGGVKRAGTGRTINISSKGVLFETDQRLPQGACVELALKWPFLLGSVCALKLVVQGRIVRCAANSNTAAVKAESYEFRTAGLRRQQNERRMAETGADAYRDKASTNRLVPAVPSQGIYRPTVVGSIPVAG